MISKITRMLNKNFTDSFRVFVIRILTILPAMGFFTNISFAQCVANSTSTWNTPATWNTCGGSFPTGANQVVINAGFNVFLSASQTAGNLAGTGTVSSVGSNILSIGSALANTTFSGVIQNGAGTTGITKVGTNTQTFSGTNTYTGVTTINAGVLSVGTINNGGASGNLGQATAVATNLVLGGGTLQYTGGSASTDRAFALTAGTTSSINVTTAGTTLTMSGASGNGTNGALTKTGSGTLLLSGANTYTGLTTISAGTLRVGSNTALGTSAGGTSVTSGAALDLNGINYSTTEALTLNGTGTGATTGALLNSNAAAATFAGTVALGSSSTINATNQITVSGVVSGANTNDLTKEGAGLLILSGTNTYSGDTRINAGTLRAGSTQAFGSASAVLMANTAGAILDLNNNNNTIGSLTGGGATGGNVTLGSAILTIGTDNTSPATYAGVLSGTGGVTKSGTGTLTLSGTNTYTGVTTINTGVVSVGSINNGGVAGNLGQAGAAATNLVLGGGTLQYTGASASTDRAFALTAGTTSSIDVTTAGTTLTMSSASGNGTNGALTKIGSGTLLLSGTNTYTGVTTINAGVVSVGSINNGGVAGNLGQATAVVTNLVLGGGTLQYTGASASTDRAFALTAGTTSSIEVTTAGTTLTMSGASGNGTDGDLTKTGSGTLVLSGVNTYTGTTTINAGVLSVGSINNGGASGNLGQASSAATNLVLGGGTLRYTGGTTSTDRAFALTAGTTSSIEVTTAATTLTISGSSGNGTNGDLTKIGSGTLILSGTNTYSGDTRVNAGTLRAGSTQAFGLASSVVMANTAGAILDLNNNNNTIGSLTGGGVTGGNVTLGNATLTVGSDNTSPATYAGVISGTGSVKKTGTGTLTLSGTNTFSGTLTITQGGVTLGAGVSLPSSVLLNGGTLTGGSTNVSMGTLTTQNSGNANGFTSNSKITLGTGNLSFSGLGATGGGNWNNSFVEVTDWVGSYNGTTGTGGKLIVGSTLSAAQLLLFRFYNNITGKYHTATQLPSGEIIPNTLASASPANCSAGVPAAPTVPACGSLTSLSGTGGALANNTKYVWSTASSCAISGTQTSGNITTGDVNSEIYVRSGETLNIGDFSALGGKLYIMSGATVNMSGNFNNSGKIYVYGTLNMTSVGLQASNAIYIASTGVANVTGTMALNSGNIINAGALNIASTANWASSVICQVDGGCTKLSTTGGLTFNNANISANVGTLYWPSTTCPNSPANEVSNSATFTMDPNTRICTGQTNPSDNPTSTQCAFWGAAQVVWGCVPASGTCAGAVPLPIILSFFKPTLTNEGVIVKWGTNSQWDSDHFIIEKSKNGIDWEYVSELPSQNGKYHFKEFSITDPNPYEGDSYYRLVEVDTNGKRTVYATDFIHNDMKFTGFSIYPNPSNGSFIMSINGDSPQYQLNLFDVLGKNIGVYTLLSGKNEISSGLSSGMYLAKLKVGHDYFTQKIVVK